MSKRVKFNPNMRPRIPVGARSKGRTVFHVMASLWDKAKREHDGDASAAGAIKLYEDYCVAVNNWYAMLSEALRAAEEAVKEAGLLPNSEEGIALNRRVYREYQAAHEVEFPSV